VRKNAVFSLLFVALANCAETSIQPLSQTSFKVATVSECGASGTRDIAFRAAAIEVIRRGGDRFIVVGDGSGSTVAGGQFTPYGGFTTYSINNQDMLIQLRPQNDTNALSARQTLGPNWQEIVAEGVPQTCI
jgi:hypothetical protein